MKFGHSVTSYFKGYDLRCLVSMNTGDAGNYMSNIKLVPATTILYIISDEQNLLAILLPRILYLSENRLVRTIYGGHLFSSS